jgi:predicted DNA-binding transcriptional regulator AlpA
MCGGNFKVERAPMEKQATLCSLKRVSEKTGGLSGRHIMRMVEEGKFPQSVRLTEGSAHRKGRIAFVESEVDAWIAARIAERHAAPREPNPKDPAPRQTAEPSAPVPSRRRDKRADANRDDRLLAG